MAEKARDALEIFPAEIWELILEELRKQGSSQDVLNCSKVCTEFERILEPTKQEWLFGSICPFILPYLKGSELLACRRICKNWRRGVDNFLEDFETWRPFDEGTSDISRSTRYDPLERKGIKWTRIWNDDKLVNFLEWMKKQEMKTPFVLRSLSLLDLIWGRGRGMEFFFEKALQLLRLYGDHIWHLHVMQPIQPYRFYQLVKQMLSCTPNLKSLTFDGYSTDQFEDDIIELELLEIKSLETLEIQTKSSLLPVLILAKLNTIINLENVKCLKLRCANSDYYYEPYAGVTRLQHLSELHVSGIKWADLEGILDNMISPTAPLAKLGMGLDGVRNANEIDFEWLCNILNKWKGTLRMLVIKGKTTSDFMEPGLGISLTKLDALNLKSLELEGILFEMGLLSPALTASLEYLHIGYNDRHRSFHGPGMEFYKCVFEAGELHNSSIWGEMRKLKFIRVHHTYHWLFDGPENVICTREMHERGIRAKTVEPGYVHCISDGED